MVYQWMIHPAGNSGKALGLEDDQVSIDARPIDGIARKASGLTPMETASCDESRLVVELDAARKPSGLLVLQGAGTA